MNSMPALQTLRRERTKNRLAEIDLRLINNFDFLIPIILGLFLLLLQIVRISVDLAHWDTAPRLLFDAGRFATFSLLMLSIVALVPVIASLRAHALSLSRFDQKTSILVAEISAAKAGQKRSDKVITQEHVYRTLDEIVTRAATLFRNELGKQCRLTIKILTEPPAGSESSGPHVVTFLRDGETREYGSVAELGRPFPYAENTAFQAIIDKGQTYFSSGDLQELAAQGLYKNANPLWQKLYNSTIVVPVGSSENKGIIGFLCIDSAECNVDRSWLRSRLVLYADQVYNLFRVLYNIHRAADVGDKQATSRIGWGKSNGNISPFDEEALRNIQFVLQRLQKTDDHANARAVTRGSSDVLGSGIVQERGSWEEVMPTADDAELAFEAVLLRRRKALSARLAETGSAEKRARPSYSELKLVARSVLSPNEITAEEAKELEKVFQSYPNLQKQAAELRANSQSLSRGLEP